MGLTADIAGAVATKVAAVSGIRGCSPRDPDSIPAYPWAVVGLPKVSIQPGTWETLTYTFPVRVYVARAADGPRATASCYDLFDATLVALRTGIKYGLSASGVAEGILSDAELDRFWEIGGELYQGVEMTLVVSIGRGTTYTA